MSQNNSTTNDTNTAENKAPTSYKQQLDEVASEVKYPKNENQGGIVNKVVETVSQYVPAVGNVLGKGQKEENTTASGSEDIDTQVPALPHHSTQVEEFVRDQHRSNTDDYEIGKK
ncbi:hypothetical protein VPNG_05633 [Cytospora leucostoma]|uniref:Uncharacterized protein n=1 Tax=Cytospora leucostoma TaxID=1230097 RepID=A0A423X730_9PEZI|nr:hypothetical protein VPNG_05633 [Cytospora leucostoma]